MNWREPWEVLSPSEYGTADVRRGLEVGARVTVTGPGSLAGGAVVVQGLEGARVRVQYDSGEVAEYFAWRVWPS